MSGTTTNCASPPPDWELVHFPVACPRCGEDLRGRSAPACPRCAFGFEWSDLVPIQELQCAQCHYLLYGLREPRCPECGTPFDWSEALERSRMRALPLFEYWWRKRFLRSAHRTWRLTMRPKKLWLTVGLQHGPRLGPLFGFVFLSLGMGWLAWLGGYAASHVIEAIYVWRTWAPSSSLWDCLASTLVNTSFGFGPESQLSLPFAAWVGALLLSLLLFTQSMRRLGLKMNHLVRVWAYAVTPGLPITSLITSFAVNSDLGFGLYSTTTSRIISWLLVLTLPGYWVMTTWSMRQGLARYVKMKHALWVAISVQLIALLSGMFASLLPRLLGWGY